ncbi:MAG: NnrU family protein [Gammaproteobacteria bacterium]|nr:NnrU family protein [Gammaproteobacteria bacterium]
MTTLVAGLVIFFAVHTFTMFRGARDQLVAKLGPLPYRGLYSLISIAGFVLLVMGYADAPRIAVWAPPIWMRHVTMLLMLPVFILLPAMYLPGYIKARVKNPMLIAVKTWAFAHLLINGDLASILLFGSFLVFCVVDLIVVKRTGRSPVVAEPKAVYDVVAVVAGLGIYVLIAAWAHVYIAGVPVMVL